MSIPEISPEQLAEVFHHYRQALARELASASTPGWEQLPEGEKSRLIAAARLAVLGLAARVGREDSRHYFAKPGEAEWGC